MCLQKRACQGTARLSAWRCTQQREPTLPLTCYTTTRTRLFFGVVERVTLTGPPTKRNSPALAKAKAKAKAPLPRRPVLVKPNAPFSIRSHAPCTPARPQTTKRTLVIGNSRIIKTKPRRASLFCSSKLKHPIIHSVSPASMEIWRGKWRLEQARVRLPPSLLRCALVERR